MKSIGIFVTRLAGVTLILTAALIPLGTQWLYHSGPDWMRMNNPVSGEGPAAGI